MLKKITDQFHIPSTDDHFQSSEDLLRCGWNRNSNHRCKLPGSVKPQGESHHLCRWHSQIVLFKGPQVAKDETTFNEWIEAKRPTWVPVTTADIWIKPNHEIFKMAKGE